MKFLKPLFLTFFIISLFVGISLSVQASSANPIPMGPCDPVAYSNGFDSGDTIYYNAEACALENQGFSCTYRDRTGGATCPVGSSCVYSYSSSYTSGCSWCWQLHTVTYDCTKVVTTYSATPVSAYTLQGTSALINTINFLVMYTYDSGKPSPFIYFHNAPEGSITVSLSSALNTFFPKPLFNQKNGWKVKSHNGSLSVDSKKVDNLFYELGLRGVTMTRHGKNFASKEEVIAYLSDSDFLTKLGFNEEEKKNSLGYFIPKIQSSPIKKNYYLSILDADSIAKTSTLTITPKPNRIDRQYFAVYPTDTPVKTLGTFVFPKHGKENGFTVKETGEFLIEPSMTVIFK
jgi:hypothetical protein